VTSQRAVWTSLRKLAKISELGARLPDRHCATFSGLLCNQRAIEGTPRASCAW
jgi:hypothetical protein